MIHRPDTGLVRECFYIALASKQDAPAEQEDIDHIEIKVLWGWFGREILTLSLFSEEPTRQPPPCGQRNLIRMVLQARLDT
jgi:hypothetical protein